MAPQNRPQPDERLPLPPLGHGPGGDRGHGVHEGHHVEEEADDGRAADVAMASPDRAKPPCHRNTQLPLPMSASPTRLGVAEVVARQQVAVAAEHEGVADEEVADEAEAEDGEVRRHHVGGVLGTAEAGLDQGEAGLHEDDEHGADDDPEQVGLLPEGGDRLGGIDVLRAGDARCGEDQGAREGQPQSCFPPDRHAGSRVTTRANGHGYAFLSDVPEEEAGRRCLTRW